MRTNPMGRSWAPLVATLWLCDCTVEDPNYGGTDPTVRATSDVTTAGGETTGTGPSPQVPATSTSLATSGATSSDAGDASTGSGGSSGTGRAPASTDGADTGAGPCGTDDDCVDPAAPACDAAKGRCVECRTDAHCGGLTPICDGSASACVECLSAGDCPGGVCLAAQCQPYHTPCTEDVECPAVAGTVCCSAGQCSDTCAIPCIDTLDCPAGTECAHDHCLTQCSLDFDCAMFDDFTCQHAIDGINTLCEND